MSNGGGSCLFSKVFKEILLNLFGLYYYPSNIKGSRILYASLIDPSYYHFRNPMRNSLM